MALVSAAEPTGERTFPAPTLVATLEGRRTGAPHHGHGHLVLHLLLAPLLRLAPAVPAPASRIRRFFVAHVSRSLPSAPRRLLQRWSISIHFEIHLKVIPWLPILQVLISPAIYVYRNQVAQKEAGRVIQQLVYCRWAGSGSSATLRYGLDGHHDPMMGIAAPLVLGGAGLTHHSNHHHQTIHRTSSSLSNRSSSGGGNSLLQPSSALTVQGSGGFSRRSSNGLFAASRRCSAGNESSGTLESSPALPPRHPPSGEHQALLKSPEDRPLQKRPSVVISLATETSGQPTSHKRGSVSCGSPSLLAADSSAPTEIATESSTRNGGVQRQRSLTISTGQSVRSRSPSPLLGSRPSTSPVPGRSPAKTQPVRFYLFFQFYFPK